MQVGDKPTRGAKILDLILTNMEHYVIEVKVGETLGNSDHRIIRFNITFNKDRILNKPRVPNYQKGLYERLLQLLGVVNWDENFRDRTAQEMWDN